LKLVKLLLSGIATAVDYPNAYFWLLVTHRNGNKEALEQAEKVCPFLLTHHAEELKMAAASWRPKPEKAAQSRTRRNTQPAAAPRRMEANAKAQPQSKNLHTKQQPQGAISSFDELRIYELIRHSGKLKTPLNSINDLTALTQWSKKKDPFESVFLALYRGLRFDAAAHLGEESKRKLDAWLAYCKLHRI
jgi:hypothetical protein